MYQYIVFHLTNNIKKILFIFTFMFFSVIGFNLSKCIYNIYNPVVIAFSVDNNYALFIPVTIKSIEKHSNPNRLYKIFVLGNKISDKNAQNILKLQSKNIKIKIININDYVVKENIDTFRTLMHINTATYYRFFIPEILKDYKKALYLEADQILLDDVAHLFDTNLNNQSLGVIPQPQYQGTQSQSWQHYCRHTLKMTNYEVYFNAGVLVMNLEKLRKNHFRKKALELAQTKNFTYLDQDILNFMFSNDCTVISHAWNVEIFILRQKPKYTTPKLIHFTAYYKPWNTSKPNQNSFPYSDLFWEYARQTDSYNDILNLATKK